MADAGNNSNCLQEILKEEEMIKVIGLMLTWNNLEFFKCALGQALGFCDELILVEGCHSMKYPKHSTDGTCEYIETIKKSPKLVIRDFERGDRYDIIQLRIRQNFPKRSVLYRPGNWIIQWDDDFFFFDRDLIQLRTAMETAKQDSLDTQMRHFIYNFKFNSSWSCVHCYRIVDGLQLTGISTPRYPSGKPLRKEKLEGVEVFHYSSVKKPERLRARTVMSVEKGNAKAKTGYERFMSVTWDEDEDIFKSKATVESLRGGRGLNIYNREHPEAISDHPWRYIKDVREVK